MSYLDLALQALARHESRAFLGSAVSPANEKTKKPVAASPPYEFNELTKKPVPRSPAQAITGTLRAAYRRTFAFTVAERDGQPMDSRDAAALHQDILGLTDDAGPLWADAILTNELRRFRAETGRCGLCGGLGHRQED
jgi:hypothetical protein